VPVAGPFYFAWVEPEETTFDETHHRMDEYIFSAKRILAEGEKPLLEIEIQNPHVGILSPERKYWAWFAWDNGDEIVPLFFGRVVGSPVEIFEEVIKLQLVADPIDYQQRVQLVAETMKVPPFYDPVFIDVGQRDDPNTILEAYAKVWDVDAVTHAVTANDIITGDSNEDFTGDDHFYDGMQMTIGQPPAAAILMDASVSWTQTAQGLVDITNGYRSFDSCLNGDAIISEWPKPATDIGGGYKVYFADAFDTAGAETAEMVTLGYGFKNGDKKHQNGDTLSMTVSWSEPMGGKVWAKKVMTWQSQSGALDPFATDSDGDPAPVNIPPSASSTTAYVMGWNVVASLTLKYEAARRRSERVVFLVGAETQLNPEPSQNSEVLTKSGADVGVPIVNLKNWTTIAGTAVAIGQIIFPDNPAVPGTKSAQICITAGTAGVEQPAFSDVPGFTTNDGSVVWSSLGAATPPDNAVDWTAESHVNAGTVILPQRPFVVDLATLKLPGSHAHPQTELQLAEGTYLRMIDGSYAVCTSAGNYPGSAVVTPLASLPSGRSYFVATTAGTSGAQYLIPPFNETLHATTSDGSVVWTCTGIGEIPAGGTPGDVHAATYFATDRGRQSLEYLAALVRAKLLYRARCIEIQFDCDYARGTTLTTRKTATLHDPRIAGGVALGKIKGAELSVSDTGVAGCRVTLACCAGFGDAIEEVAGDPAYVDDGYVDDGYQWHDNVTIVLPDTTDLGYAPPFYVASDDGLTFPLTRQDIVLVDVFHQGEDVAYKALDSMAAAAQASTKPPDQMSRDEWLHQQQVEQVMLGANTLPQWLEKNPSWQEFQLRPVTGSFNKIYNIKFTNLTVPMGIDLQSGVAT
jgi:hypothetical protein